MPGARRPLKVYKQFRYKVDRRGDDDGVLGEGGGGRGKSVLEGASPGNFEIMFSQLVTVK